MARLLREEEVKWYQRSKAQLILQGDSNMRYFHMAAMGKSIYSPQQDEGRIESQAELKDYITKYYESLFRETEDGHISLDEARTEDIPQVSDVENDILTSPFTEEEVRVAVF